MKDLKHEAHRRHEEKLKHYGASHEQARAHGGHVHKVTCETGPEIKRAHGGKAAHEGHPHRERDLKLIEELEHDHEKKHGGKVHHRAMGGPIPGGSGPRLGRGRKGGKGRTSVNIAIGKPGGDVGPAAGAAPLPIGGSTGPAMPSAPPPRPLLPAGAAPAVGPRPMPPAGPMKHGGHVRKEHHSKHGKHHSKHHERHGHSGHRG